MADYIFFDFTLTGNKYFNGRKYSSILNKSLISINFEWNARYIPEHAVKPVLSWLSLIIASQNCKWRQTRHSDYRKGLNGKHEITVNSSLNKYKFLITLIHEISHLVAFEIRTKYKTAWEWMSIRFNSRWFTFIRPEIFQIIYCL
jgi:hypothetical protein